MILFSEKHSKNELGISHDNQFGLAVTAQGGMVWVWVWVGHMQEK